MANDDRNDGLILGTRPGDVPGETNFGAYADRDYEDEMEEEQLKQEQFERNAARGTQVVNTTNSLDGVGRFVLPRAHYDDIKGKPRITYADHLNISQAGKLRYNPRQCMIFDGEIQAALDQPFLPFIGDSRWHDGMTNPKNQYYKGYKPLRQNVEVLYNSLCTMYFPDGEYNPEDPADKAKRAKLHQIARKLASELKWQARYERLANIFTFDTSEDDIAAKRFGKYGLEHIGVRKMYEYLYNQQEGVSWNPINWLRGKANRYNWELPHPEDSPFSTQDLQEVLRGETRDEEMGITALGPELCDRALDIEGIAAKLKSGVVVNNVAQMDDEQREESVELAREILRRLKEVCAGRSDRAREGVNHERQDLERSHLVHGLAEDYLQLYESLLALDPSIQADSTFERARLALGKMGHMTMLNALLASNSENKQEIRAAYDALPDEYKKVANDTEEALIRDVEVAVEEMSHRLNVPRQATPDVKQKAQAVALNMHSTMTGARIQSASVNVIEKAQQINQMNTTQKAPISAAGMAASDLGKGGAPAGTTAVVNTSGRRPSTSMNQKNIQMDTLEAAARAGKGNQNQTQPSPNGGGRSQRSV